MLEIQIPGRGKFQFEHLVLDYNGTLAVDGCLIKGLAAHIGKVAQFLDIIILTSDTYGTVTEQMQELPVSVSILSSQDHTQEKAEVVSTLGCGKTIAIGNGSNDSAMLACAALGIVVINQEGASIKAVTAADLIYNNILDAFHAILHPKRIGASLRE